MTNVYGNTLQKVLRHKKAPNCVKMITFGVPENPVVGMF